jgi:hypothetical protein
MKHKEELVLTLKNKTPELFKIWVDLEPEINRVAEKSGVIIADTIYDYTKMIKNCDVYFDSELNFMQAVVDIQQLSVPKGVLPEVVRRQSVPCDCHLVPKIMTLLREHKDKYPL